MPLIFTAPLEENPATAPIVSIIIPVYGDSPLTGQCVKAILSAPHPDKFEIIVVDDGSPSPVALDDFSGHPVRVMRRDINGGFAAACNYGAQQTEARYLLFLNNDTIPVGDWLQPLLSTIETRPEVGLVSPKLLFPDMTVQHCGKVWKDLSAPDLQPHHIYYKLPAFDPCVSRSRYFTMLTGACLLTRRRDFEEVGGFDVRYTNGWEDDDLCYAYGSKGLSCYYCADSMVFHLEGMTLGNDSHSAFNSIKRRKIFQMNRELFFSKWGKYIRRDDGYFYHEDGFEIDPDHSRYSPQLQKLSGSPCFPSDPVWSNR